MAQYKGYPIERMTSKPSTTTIRSNPTSSSSIQGGYANINTSTTTRTNTNIQGGQIRSTPSSSSSMARTSSNSIPSRYNQQCSSNPKQYAMRTNPTSSTSTRNSHNSSSGSSGYVSSQRTTPTMNTRTNTMSSQNNHNNNLSSKYRALANQARTKSEASKYIRGIVIVTPQNETTHGWIYSKSTNMMYQLQWNNNKHYIVDQVVLFSPSSL